jgi:hypothetical protein
MNFFHHKDLGNNLLQLCPKVVKHPVFITSTADIKLIREVISCYQAASGAQLNIGKSKAMAMGSWDASTDVMGIPYHTIIKILGVRMHNTVSQFAKKSWSAVTERIQTQAHDA